MDRKIEIGKETKTEAGTDAEVETKTETGMAAEAWTDAEDRKSVV